LISADHGNNKSSRERRLIQRGNRDYILVSIEEYEQYRQWAENKIDGRKILSFLTENRKFFFKAVTVFFILGVVISFLIPSQYTSTALLMPEYSIESSTVGNAEQFFQKYGRMLGIGNGTYASNSNAIRVELYPQIVSSLPFQLDMINQEFYYPRYKTTVSVFEFFEELYRPTAWDYLINYSIGLPLTVKTLISDWVITEKEQQKSSPSKENNIIAIDSQKMQLIDWMRQQVFVSVDQESGIVGIQATMPTPKLSADIAKRTIDNLTKYLVQYRTNKIKVDLTYLEKEHAKAEQRFFKIRDSLAIFRDQNKYISTARAQTEEQKLQSEYDLAFSLYSGISQKLEETRLRLQEETPVFEVLEPVQVPVERSSPNRILVIILFLFAGIFGALGYLFFGSRYKELVTY